jgi:hypothetical protein
MEILSLALPLLSGIGQAIENACFAEDAMES